MSVQSAAAHARTHQVGRAEQMVRSATGALGSFPVVQRVGAGAHVLAVAEQLLVAALAEVRSVQQQLAVLPEVDDEPDAGAPAALAPQPSAPAAPAAAATPVAHGGRPTPLTVNGHRVTGAVVSMPQIA